MAKKLTLTERILFGIVVGSATGFAVEAKYNDKPMEKVYTASGISALVGLSYSLATRKNNKEDQHSDYQI